MLERKHKGVLSLNLKKLASRFDDLKIILILQNEMSLLMLFCKRVLKGKAYQDIIFLIACLQNNIIPKFFNFRLSNPYLKSSRAYIMLVS